MNDTAVVMYTHSEYSDVWPIFFGQFKKLFPFKDIPKYVFCDKRHIGIPDEWKTILYKEKDPYADRFLSCLSQIKEEFVLWQHEDMILYDRPLELILNGLPGALKVHNLPFIKFCLATEVVEKEDRISPIKKICRRSSWMFSIQPGIWQTESLKKVYKMTPGRDVWSFEEKAQLLCEATEMYGAVWHNDEPKRGRYHYDSKLYPYIATAVVKGKWTNEYPELLGLLDEYGIDPTERGFYSE